MSVEPEFQAHYRCYWCGSLRYRSAIRFIDDHPICTDKNCREQYYKSTEPLTVNNWPGAFK